MNILALTTSSPLLGVALKKGDGAVCQKTIEGFLTHAENLMPATGQLLREAGLKLKEIDAVLMDRGPGSFTGLRVGFATLKGWRAAEPLACFGALSLDIIAEGVHPDEKRTPLAVCLDAHREKLYFRLYEPAGGTWRAVTDPGVLSLADCLKKIPASCTLTGNALDRYGEAVKKGAKNKKVNYLSRDSWYPKAATLIEMFLSFRMSSPRKRGSITLDFRLRGNDTELVESSINELSKPEDFIPSYFRLSEPEERKKAHADAC